MSTNGKPELNMNQKDEFSLERSLKKQHKMATKHRFNSVFIKTHFNLE